MELLPPHCEADHPDDHGPQAVQHHTSSGTDFFRDTDSSKVEEGDAADVAQQSQNDQRLIPHLAKSIQGIFQDATVAAAELAGWDVVKGDQQ